MLLEQILSEANVDLKSNYNQAVKMIAQIAPVMKHGGLSVDGRTLAPILNVRPDYAEQILQWGVNKGKLSRDIQGPPVANDPVKRLAVDAFMAKNQGGGLGLERVSARTGLSTSQIVDIVQNNWDNLASSAGELGINLKPAFYGSTQKKHTGYDKGNESLADAIRRTMADLTDNFSSAKAASVAAQEIADELGVARTTVDRELSNNPSLRDLEPFRKIGKRPGMTDEDRAARYQKIRYQQS